MTFPRAYGEVVARLRVPSGFLLVILFAWLSNPSILSIAAGAPISLVGLLVRAWAAGHLAKNRSLAVTGPYALVRNPLYIGTALVAAGLVVSTRSWVVAVVFATVFVFVYLPVIQREEQHLRKLFPEYGEYAHRVRQLMPRAAPAAELRGWSSRLYVRNEEWQAAAGYLAGLAFLIAKAIIRGTP